MKVWQSVFLAAFLAGCGDDVFRPEDAQSTIESGNLSLNGEQVLLSPSEVTCGEKRGLWIVSQIDGGGAVGRLTGEGRDLGFGDDVRMGDRKYSNPYIQLRGSFPLKVQQITSMVDENPDVKVIEAKAGVVISHSCFPKPLPLLGIARGDFSEDAAPRIRLRHHNGWTADQILH